MASNGKLIAITGCTAGLGLAMVTKFQQMGHSVVGCGRNKEVISELNTKYSSNDGTSHFDVVDVSCSDEVKSWIAKLVDTFGCPSFFLNNAAILNEQEELWNVPVDVFSKLVDINIKGTFHCIKYIVPVMIAHKKGVIVNFSSGWGRYTDPLVAPYCCSKYAIEGLSQAMAKELPSPLAVVALSPGVVNTAMLHTAFGSERAELCISSTDWADLACPYILSFDRDHNGASLTTENPS